LDDLLVVACGSNRFHQQEIVPLRHPEGEITKRQVQTLSAVLVVVRRIGHSGPVERDLPSSEGATRQISLVDVLEAVDVLGRASRTIGQQCSCAADDLHPDWLGQ
jgi:hypothetical protein